MAIATVSLSFSLGPQKPNQTLHLTPLPTLPKQPICSFRKSYRYNFKSPVFSSSHSSSSSSPPSSATTTTGSYSFLEERFRTESMLLPLGYESLLRFLVKQYLMERTAVLPHAVTLIGFYRKRGESEEEREVLAGTVEVSFDKRGANASPPTPTPPKNSPYICNMTVKKPLRRKGIGWHLLKASEELISQMSSSNEVYLHCRMIDVAPFNIYIKAGYNIVKTDSILILLMLQRRKHLMCKKLPVFDSFSELEMPISDEELTL